MNLKIGEKKAQQSNFFVKRSSSLWERAFLLTELVLQPLLLLSAGYQRAAVTSLGVQGGDGEKAESRQ